jgi:hypothetical protein
MPIEVLERLNSRPKMIADPKTTLEQLRRKQEPPRKQWWNELLAIEKEYDSLAYQRNKFLDADIAIAKLKLAVTFVDNGESLPQECFFSEDAYTLLRDFEEFAVYDRLSSQEIIDIANNGADEQGLQRLAEYAAENNYHQINNVMSEKNIPDELSFALTRIYQQRIVKMQASALNYIKNNQVNLATQVEMEESQSDVNIPYTVAEQSNSNEISSVNAAEARLLENNYAGQVEMRLRETDSELNWGRIEVGDNLRQIHRELGEIEPVSFGAIEKKNPVGLTVKASVEQRKGLKRKLTHVLQVKVLSNSKQLYFKGIDSQKMTDTDMSQQSREAINTSKDCSYVLVLASTIGWTKKAIELVKSGNVLSPNISLVLVDLKGRGIFYNQIDRKLGPVLYYINLK